MVAAIDSRTLLRQRYLIKQVLGQGGFGRTYLALDRERFDEPCVLKEFAVSYQDETLIEKAKALFLREANILHQIQHPQIPRFWAAFEWDDRLFLAQDYIPGQTYRALLQQRREQGETFSEAEVLHLLNHLLPVLSYLHDRQIIHRDISPENLVLNRREHGDLSPEDYTEGLPVLLDFGSVKEATSGLALISGVTRVGKIGYAPPEQLQTGNAQPHSDLYALAATAVVLLTGREPHQLLDSLTLDWQWQPYAPVSRELSKILNRMLSLHPGDRYPTAKAVHADLQRLLGVLAPMLRWPGVATIMPPGQSRPMALTTLPTPSLPETTLQPLPSDDQASCRWQRWLGSGQQRVKWAEASPRLAVASSLLVTAGIGTIVLRSPLPVSQQILQQDVVVQDGRHRSSEPETHPEPEAIQFAANQVSATVQGQLGETSKIYHLAGQKGQIISLNLTGQDVRLNFLRANQSAVAQSSRDTQNWTGILPASESYQIQLTGSGSYALDATIAPTQVKPTPAMSSFNTEPSQTITGTAGPGRSAQHRVNLDRSGPFLIKVLQGDVQLKAIGPGSKTLIKTSNHWKGQAAPGEYSIEVTAKKRVDYAILVEYQGTTR
jgi:serine/threonine protein kinase